MKGMKTVIQKWRISTLSKVDPLKIWVKSKEGLSRLISKRHKKGLLPCHSSLLPPSGWVGDHHKHLSGLGRGAEERKGLCTGFLPVTSGHQGRRRPPPQVVSGCPESWVSPAPCTPCRGAAPSEPPCSGSQPRTPSCPTWAPSMLMLVLLPGVLMPGLVS